VLKTGVIEFPTGRCTLVEPRHALNESADTLPDLPVLPETLLALELQLRGYSVDLRAFSEAVLSDLGAVVQVLRMAGREYGAVDDRPIRIEDYICDFGPAACFEAIAKGTVARSHQRRAVSEFWAHAREIALNAKRLADTIPWAINPDQAYMAGMMHAIGSLPSVLGWNWSEDSHDFAATALKLAERWAFPGYLRDFFCEMLMPGYNPQWSEMIIEAHDLAGGQANRCIIFDAAIRPSA
jgi:hypothetical protein